MNLNGKRQAGEQASACVQACPWHMPTVNPVTHKSSKCIMCGACAEGCPSGALSIVPWEAIVSVSQKI
ncbi:MAG: 4Fe-4S binding protein [Clostridia bacterium]|nr:4Fe-4S binding protein [Clostridia bacterium]